MKKFYGYIEGYYGRMLSWENRHSLLDHMHSLHLNTYLYGPKEDPFHRHDWKAPYPKTWLSLFKDFVEQGEKRGITVIPSLSPGLSFDYTSEEDYAVCLAKFNTFVLCGARYLTLFMDDIPEKLPDNCTDSFKSLGQAHALLLARLQKDLRKKHPTVRLWFCPTVYCDQFAKTEIKSNEYLHDLAAQIPSDIALLWTGPKIVSPTITKKNIAEVSGIFKGNIIIWDNFYANDYCPDRLFVGPFTGRSKTLLSSIKGLCINPTGLPNTDMLLLENLSVVITGKQSRRSASYLLKNNIQIPKEFKTIARFFQSPFARMRRIDLSIDNIARYKKALHLLIWDWKSPLHREWYPYLFAIDRDLTLYDKMAAKGVTETWLRKKYSPALSEILIMKLSEKYMDEKQ